MRTASRNTFSRLISLIVRCARCRSGVSAVEFSLLAPMFVIGGFLMVDTGRAVFDKMMITQALRAGAHSAIAAQSEAAVQQIVVDTASENFTVVTGAPAAGQLGVTVSSYCVCPSDFTTTVSCSSTCTGGSSPNQFYDLSAEMEFVGVMLPNFSLSGEMSVLAQ